MENEVNSTLKRLILNKIFNSYSNFQSPVHSIYNLTTPQNCFILSCCQTFIPSLDLVIEELRIKHWLRQQLTFPHPKLLSLSSRPLVVSPVWLLELLELPFCLWCFLNSFFSFALSPWLLRFLSDELMDNDSPLMIVVLLPSSLVSHSCSDLPRLPSLGWLISQLLLLVALPMNSFCIPNRLETTWPIRRDNQTSSVDIFSSNWHPVHHDHPKFQLFLPHVLDSPSFNNHFTWMSFTDCTPRWIDYFSVAFRHWFQHIHHDFVLYTIFNSFSTIQ